MGAGQHFVTKVTTALVSHDAEEEPKLWTNASANEVLDEVEDTVQE